MEHFFAEQKTGLLVDAALRQLAGEFDLLPLLNKLVRALILNPCKKFQRGDRTERPAVAGAMREQESPFLRGYRPILNVAEDVRVEDGRRSQRL